uniref:Uncharacterized protein n=1 Tax=Siphoviridae sp. ctZHD14 TaxID=2827891 RepID=A0A8S5SW76_9CAUD|nr:MAG TPA: hypothetical protein [Siphoviridae sp. ctZHD14]
MLYRLYYRYRKRGASARPVLWILREHAQK